MGSSLFNFSRRATRDADRLEIRKCDQLTNRLTWVGARDACASKKAAAKSTAKVTEVGGAEETVNSLDFQCSQCDLHFNAEEELKIHMEEDHTVSNLSTPEKERLPDQTCDLTLTPVHTERIEAQEAVSLPSYVPDMSKTKCDDCNIQFPDNNEFTFHNWCCHPGR